MQEINLYDLVKYYARNWANLLTAIFIGAIIGLVYTFYIQEPLYRSEATMLVVSSSRTTQDTTINNNYTELFKSRRVLQTVIQRQGYDGDYQQLLARTTATNDRNTDIIRVSIADPDPAKSQQLLKASLDTFKKEASGLYEANNIEGVDNATLPSEPYNVNVVIQVGLATAGTFFLAIILLFFVYDYRLSQGQTKAINASRKTIKPPKQPASAKQVESTKPNNRSLTRRLSNLLLGGDPPVDKRTK